MGVPHRAQNKDFSAVGQTDQRLVSSAAQTTWKPANCEIHFKTLTSTDKHRRGKNMLRPENSLLCNTCRLRENATCAVLECFQVWEISRYCTNSSEQKLTCTLLLRKLPSINRRYSTKTGTIDTKPPPLLVTFRAHLKPVVSLDFVDSRQFIISASVDASVRLWTQTGRYIGNT